MARVLLINFCNKRSFLAGNNRVFFAPYHTSNTFFARRPTHPIHSQGPVDAVVPNITSRSENAVPGRDSLKQAPAGQYEPPPFFAPNEAQLQAGKVLFSSPCIFEMASHDALSRPQHALPEFAFMGRSNVGKSSLLNALTGSKQARTSKKPGRTQTVNWFRCGPNGTLWLVDLPGYGYRSQDTWMAAVGTYLTSHSRQQLLRVCLLAQCEHGLKESDLHAMELLDSHKVPYQLVLTKADKLCSKDIAQQTMAITEYIAQHTVCCLPWPFVTSATTGLGIAQLRAFLAHSITLQ